MAIITKTIIFYGLEGAIPANGGSGPRQIIRKKG